MLKKAIILVSIAAVFFLLYKQTKKINFNSTHEVGDKIDSLNQVMVYYNGGVGNVVERNTADGYNLGLKFQCVEFVKRYYYEFYNHKMPDSYGHAISFYKNNLGDGELNTQRNLMQYNNPSASQPQKGDLIIMDKTLLNRYGHVAIISKITRNEIEIIQQNPGPFSASRESFPIIIIGNGKWKIENERILGWLRKNPKNN